MDYKCRWYGRNLVKIDQWFPSSKRCSNCGHIVDKMPLDIRDWTCPSCGFDHDRDVNASVNILRSCPGGRFPPAHFAAAGLAVSVCGATVRPEQNKSVKAGAKSPKGKKQKPKS